MTDADAGGRAPRVVAFGETMVRLAPPGTERIEAADSFEVRVGGAESNVAAALARLGCEAAWASKLPDSPLGRRVVAGVREHGVEPLVTWSDEGRQGVYYLERGRGPRGLEVVYDRRDAPVRTATPDELPLDRVRAADALFVSGITPALSGTLAETTGELLRVAGHAGTLTAFDVNYRSKLWSPGEARATLSRLLPGVDLLVVAERDAATVFGREGPPAEVGAALADEYGLDAAVVTCGDAGAVACRDGTVREQGAFPARSDHPVGTGDAFVGGFLARLLRGAGLDEALEYGAATAALKRSIPGDVAAVTPGEVRRVIDGETTGASR